MKKNTSKIEFKQFENFSSISLNQLATSAVQEDLEIL